MDSSEGPPNEQADTTIPLQEQKGSENGQSEMPSEQKPSNDGASVMNSTQSPMKLTEADLLIPRANPLLPKIVHPEQRQPPQCPLKDIQFVQLQRFKRYK